MKINITDNNEIINYIKNYDPELLKIYDDIEIQRSPCNGLWNVYYKNNLLGIIKKKIIKRNIYKYYFKTKNSCEYYNSRLETIYNICKNLIM